MLDASIPLQVKAPQFESPLQTIGQLMQVRDIGSQVALRQAQTQHAQQQAEQEKAVTDQKNREIADQNLIQQTFLKDPKAALEFGKNGDYSQFRGQVSEGTINSLTQAHAKGVQELTAARKGQLENDALIASKIGKTLDSLRLAGEADPAKLPELYQSAIQNMNAEGLLKSLPPGSIPQTITSMDDLKALAAKHGLWAGMTDAALAREKEQAATKASGATAAKATAEGLEATAKTSVLQRQADAAQVATALETGGPKAAEALLSQLPPERAAIFRGVTNPAIARHLGMTPEQVSSEAMKEAELKRQTAQLQESLRHNRVEEGQGAARIGIEREKSARDQHIYEQTYGEGSNEALRGVEPKLRVSATKEAQKAADEHTSAQAAQQDIQSFVDMARAGNKEANAYMPVEGVMALNTARGVKRINRQEIQAYGEKAGSLFDRIEGGLKHMASGQSIPPAVLNDIEALHKEISRNSDTVYNAKIAGINQNYRSNFKPVPSMTGGKMVTQAQVHQYATEHGIDDAHAAKVFTDSHYTVK